MMKTLEIRNKKLAGFTLMEIVVATTIFAIAVTSLLGLFNYVLKINRRSQALSQASQGMRNFVEYLVKEIQNGQIDYDVNAGITYTSGVGPCVPPGVVGGSVPAGAPATYTYQENKLGIIDTDGVQECFYLAYGPGGAFPPGTYVNAGVFASNTTVGSATYNPSPYLEIQKSNIAAQPLNPTNFSIDNLMFLVRPICDPYTVSCSNYGNAYAKVQPSVTIIIKFTAALPTGEKVPIYYQTTVSSNKYDIPNHP